MLKPSSSATKPAREGIRDALLVRLPDGTDFAIGTGFSVRERENPPAIGAMVIIRYQELSEAGVPRFPSWVGVRHDVAHKPAPATPESPAASPAIVVGGAASTKPSYFEFVSGTSSKFWEISQAATR